MLLFLLGCAPEDTRDFRYEPEPSSRLDWLEDRWSAAVEVCQPPDPLVLTYLLGGTSTSVECQEQIAADFGIQVEGFEAEGGASALGSSYEAALVLMGRDMGTVDALRDDLPTFSTPELAEKFEGFIGAREDYVREPFIEDLELAADELDQEAVSAVLYNLVTATIRNLRYVEEKTTSTGNSLAGWYEAADRTIFLTDQSDPGGVSMAGLLVHEAAHGWTDTEHTAVCNAGSGHEGEVLCDDSWYSAYGFEAAAGWLLFSSIPPEQDAESAIFFATDALLLCWSAGMITAP